MYVIIIDKIIVDLTNKKNEIKEYLKCKSRELILRI